MIARSSAFIAGAPAISRAKSSCNSGPNAPTAIGAKSPELVYPIHATTWYSPGRTSTPVMKSSLSTVANASAINRRPEPSPVSPTAIDPTRTGTIFWDAKENPRSVSKLLYTEESKKEKIPS